MTQFAIVETDNFGRDYPDENFLPIPTSSDKGAMQLVANAINNLVGQQIDRYWKVVSLPYKLQPGFEP
jgi:hypothetical protein